MKKIEIEVNKEEDLQILEALLTGMGLKFYVENKTNIKQAVIKPARQKTITDLVEELDKISIDPDADLKKLYYKDKKHGGTD